MTQAATTEDRRLTEANWSVLGLLRFLLAFSVMSCHTVNVTGYRPWLWTFGAFSSVCGFFLISGYSIAYSLDRRPVGFLRRRALRIYPLAICAILLDLALLALLGPGRIASGETVAMPPASGLVATLLLLNGVIVPTPFIFQPLWSLDCEILYYLAAPLLRRLPQAAIAAIAVASAALFAIPILHGHSGNYPLGNYGFAAASLAWIWLIGFLAQRRPGDFRLTLLAVIGGGLLTAGYATAEGPLALPLFAVVCFAVCNLGSVRLPRRCIGMAGYLGELSYPLYLFHFPVMLFAGRFLAGRSTAVMVSCCWMGSLLLAAAVYHGVDRVVRRPRQGHTAQ